MIVNLAVAAVMFGCAAYLALELANWLAARGGGTLKASLQTKTILRALIIAACAVIGSLLASYSVGPQTFAVICMVCVAVSMATWSELCFGRVPEIVLLVPLGLLLTIAIFQHQWGLVAGAAFLAAPFAVMGLMSRGKGVARADGELAAVGGAVLGFQVGLVAFGLAVLAAFFLNFSRRDGKTLVQLTPYLSSSIMLGIVAQLAVAALR